MNNLFFEHRTRDWHRRQKGLLKHPHTTKASWPVRNDKRSERYIGTYEDRRLVKYGIPYDYRSTHETVGGTPDPCLS